MMTKNTVKTPEDALLYIADCQLATVAHIAMIKSTSKGEFKRQISIAQSLVDWIVVFKIPISTNSRVYDILSSEDQSVESWASKYKKK